MSDCHIQSTFEIDNNIHNDIAIEREMGRCYRSHKHRLHKHFLKFRTKEQALANKPKEGVTAADWAYLCDHFSDPDFIV